MSIDDTIHHLHQAKSVKDPAARLGHLRIARAGLMQDSLDLEKQLRNEDPNQASLSIATGGDDDPL